jgi:L-iditol 2-dehydrogenase
VLGSNKEKGGAMRALVYQGPWQMPVQEVVAPVAGLGELVISVQAAGICGSDIHGYKGTTGRRKPPIIMGHEFSGVVSEVGEGVTRFRVGDRVVAQPLVSCGECYNCCKGLANICVNRSGLGMDLNGAYAERVKVRENMVYPLPGEMTWEQGAMVEPLSVAMHAVNLTPLQLMDTLVIIGAGAIGLLTLLAARLAWAGQIIISDMSARRLSIAASLGADLVVNVAERDPVEAVLAETQGMGAHVVIEAVGIGATVKQSLAVVRTGGHITWIGNSQPDVELSMQQVVTRELTIQGAYGFNEEFQRAIEAIHTGKIPATSLIEEVAGLEEGPDIFHNLAEGTADQVKVILRP